MSSGSGKDLRAVRQQKRKKKKKRGEEGIQVQVGFPCTATRNTPVHVVPEKNRMGGWQRGGGHTAVDKTPIRLKKPK